MNLSTEISLLSIEISTKKGGNRVSRDTYIRIRLTADQKRQIKEAAKRNKTNMSDFVLTATRTRIVNEHDGE